MDKEPQLVMRNPDEVSDFHRRYQPGAFVLGKTPCTVCGEPIGQLSDNQRDRLYAVKWKVHAACRDRVVSILDRITDVGGRRRN